ncbi:hypothetical protein AALB39_24810 [Lachnospiraceae bacterium 54-53]
MSRMFEKIVFIILISLLPAGPALSQPPPADDSYQPGGQKKLSGKYISTGTLRISNESKGQIGVYMQTLTHKDVDASIFYIFLDRWIESEERWANVGDLEFSYDKETSSPGELKSKSVSFHVKGQPKKCYYRLRGVHVIISGDHREMLSSRTDGILITK